MKKDEFCYPSDFFYIEKDIVKERFKANRFVTIIVFILWLIFGIVTMCGYYITMPFMLLYKLCENRCYR